MKLTGKNILLTGGTSGLGLETARILVSEGAIVYSMGRTLKGSLPESSSYRFISTDFSDLSKVKSTLLALKNENVKFDIVINNAGVLTSPDYAETMQGFEYSFQVNFLSHLLVSDTILREGMFSSSLIMAVVTSPVYRMAKPGFSFPSREGFRGFKTYTETKYYLLHLGSFLRDRYPSAGFMFIGYNPGTFSSGIYRMQHKWFRAVYRIGNYMLKHPGRVAGPLCSVLKREDLSFNTVYSVHGTEKPFLNAGDKEAGRFLDECLRRLG